MNSRRRKLIVRIQEREKVNGSQKTGFIAWAGHENSDRVVWQIRRQACAVPAISSRSSDRNTFLRRFCRLSSLLIGHVGLLAILPVPASTLESKSLAIL
jgi:hypothetical protein